MANIVLVWNYHINESPITNPMARKLKQELERRGHSVIISPVPLGKSFHGQIEQHHPWRAEEETEKYVAELYKKHPAANNQPVFVFDLHGTPSTLYKHALGNLGMENVHDWQVDTDSGRAIKAHLKVAPKEKHEHAFTVEMPYEMRDSPSRHLLRRMPGAKIPENMQHYRQYFTEQADMPKSAKNEYLSDIVVKKLASAIEVASIPKPRPQIKKPIQPPRHEWKFRP